jgi:hypothetical protein
MQAMVPQAAGTGAATGGVCRAEIQQEYRTCMRMAMCSETGRRNWSRYSCVKAVSCVKTGCCTLPAACML